MLASVLENGNGGRLVSRKDKDFVLKFSMKLESLN